MPSLNFVAAATRSAHGREAGLLRRLRTHDPNLDPDDVEAAIGAAQQRRSSSLHYGGFPCDIEAVVELAARARARVIEDAAHAPRPLARPSVRNAR